MVSALSNGGRRTQNSQLDQIPTDEWSRLSCAFEPVELAAKQVLYEHDQTIEHVYFLQSGCASLIIDFADGFQAEAGLVGSEGMIGLPLVHGLTSDIVTATTLIPGKALRMPANAFSRALAHMPTLTRLLTRYADAIRMQTMQLAACNGHHGLDARLARCLLVLHDRTGAGALPVTHETLAALLCAHRPSVSLSAKRLQQAGVIRCTAGVLSVLDRAGLEGAACECYGTMRDHMAAIIGRVAEAAR